MLGGRRFVVSGLCGNAQAPQLLVEFAHIRGDSRLDGSEIVVLEVLSFRRTRAEKRSAGKAKILSFFEILFRDQEIFLFGAHGGIDLFDVGYPERLQQAFGFLVDSFHRAQEGRFFVESLAGIRTKRRGYAQYAVLYERVGAGIPVCIAARLERRPQSARRKTRSVRFALDKFLTGKLGQHAAARDGGDETLVLFGGNARHGLEPVREMGGAFFQRPVFHGVGYHVGGFRRKLCVRVQASEVFLVGFARESRRHHSVVENQLTESIF